MRPTDVQRWSRRVTARGARRLLNRVDPPPPPPPEPPRPPAGQRWQEPLPAALGQERGSVTAALLERLPPELVAEIEARIALDPHAQQAYDDADPVDRGRLLLSLGLFYPVEGVAERTGLSRAQPPEEIHTMARGPLAAAGGLYEADMIADALGGAGVELGRLRSALDFGCSSGRVVRVLASAFPRIGWHGCDPNGPAIEWAREQLAPTRFFTSPDAPPLDLPDGSFDLVYAISIWSHFAPALGLRWLEEMHRLIRPGGHLLLTTHGTTTLAHDVERGLRPAAQAELIAAALTEGGAWYHAEFGEQGDWGVVNPDWGTAFTSAEWLLSHLLPRWQAIEFAPGRNHRNQDLWLLRRV